jgi:hypothetical protein
MIKIQEDQNIARAIEKSFTKNENKNINNKKMLIIKKY